MKDKPDPVGTAAFFRFQGRNIIPIIPHTKRPRATLAEVDGWKETGCDATINPDDSIAMQHGARGGTWGSDFDDPHILEEVLTDPSARERMLIVRTPKQGHHVIWQRDPEDFPPLDTALFDAAGRKIHIKNKGYTLLPPSTHPERQYGRYQFLTDCRDPAYIKWSDFLRVLNQKGFYTQADLKTAGEHAAGKGTHDYYDLLTGRYPQGTRRVKQKSLYVQKRIHGSSEAQARACVAGINAGCLPPITEPEWSQNMDDAERFYTHTVQPEMASSADAAGSGKGPAVPATKKQKLDPYRLADVIMSRDKYATTTIGEMYRENEGVYTPDGEHHISQECRRLWRDDLKIKTSEIQEVQNIVRDATGYHSLDASFDLNPNVLNLKNGWMEISTLAFHPGHDAVQPSLIQYDTVYDPAARCPRFVKFLKTSLEADPIKVTTVLEMMALCFLPNGVVEKGFMLVGGGSNGKSTFLNVLCSLLAERNVIGNTIHALATNRFAPATLEGKCTNICADIGKTGIRDTEMIKKIIGGDLINCEKKFLGTYTFRPRTTLIFSANELPEVDDASDGFARKFEIVQWEQQFVGFERDMSLRELASNEAEKSGILNMLIPVMRHLLATKRLKHESTMEQIRVTWLLKSNTVLNFLNESGMVERGAAVFAPKVDIYQAYLIHCHSRSLTHVSRQKFGSKMEECRLVSAKRRIDNKPVWVWEGVRLKGRPEPLQEKLRT